MLTDLILTVLHHFTMFALVSVLVVELMLVRPDLTPDRLTRLVRIDQAYGGLAMLMLIFGFSRVFFGLKGIGVLSRQSHLLDQDRALCSGRASVYCANDPVQPLAAGAGR